MSHKLPVRESLDRHDSTVHDTGPNGEPDQAQVGERFTAGDQEKNAQGGVDAQDHLQIMRLSRVPRPAGRPNDGERIDPEYKDQPNHDQRDRQIPVATRSISIHGLLLETRDEITAAFDLLLLSRVPKADGDGLCVGRAPMSRRARPPGRLFAEALLLKLALSRVLCEAF